jgi:hypothetical protein
VELGIGETEMTKWRATLIASLVGIFLGAGGGYAAALLSAEASTPVISGPSGDNFNRLFLGMGRLEALEIAAANCGGTSNTPSVLSGEAELIPKIERAAHAQGLNPPIRIAEAILAARNASVAQKTGDRELQSQQEEQAENLLEGAGWSKASAADIQGIVARLDANQCHPASSGGGQAQ